MECCREHEFELSAIYYSYTISVADSGGGGPGGPGPPFGKDQKCKRALRMINSWHYVFFLRARKNAARVGFLRAREKCATTPPPTEPRRLSETTEKFCYYPPPTESRRLGTSHERGRPLRKILDLRLNIISYFLFVISANQLIWGNF